MDEVRVFVAGAEGIMVLTPAPGVSKACDVLVAGGVTPQQAAEIAVGVARLGKDPVAFARKFLRAREAVMPPCMTGTVWLWP